VILPNLLYWLVLAFSFTDEDDDITNCSKCRNLITDPTTLPCLDSLCAACFKEVCDAHSDHSTGVATCPRCGDSFHLPTTHLQTLPDRGFIDTLVALRKIASQNLDDDSCEICKLALGKRVSSNLEPVAAAEYYCIECRQRMCAVCANRHPGCSFTKNHNVVGLGMDSAKRVFDTIKSYFPGCANHKDKPAIVHCYQCSIGLCSQCQNMHSSHEFEILTDQTYSQLTDKVKSLSDQMRHVLDACRQEIGRVQKLLTDRRNGISLAEKKINDKADELISLIQKQRDDLLSGLHSRNDPIVSSTEARSVRLSSTFLASKTALKFTRELLERGSLEDVLLNYRMLNDRVTRLCNIYDVSSLLDDYDNVSPTSLVDDVCASQDSQSKSFFFVILHLLIRMLFISLVHLQYVQKK